MDRSLMDDDMEEDLRFTGMSGGKLVHEALVECGVDTVCAEHIAISSSLLSPPLLRLRRLQL